jgi:hypothetical protein
MCLRNPQIRSVVVQPPFEINNLLPVECFFALSHDKNGEECAWESVLSPGHHESLSMVDPMKAVRSSFRMIDEATNTLYQPSHPDRDVCQILCWNRVQVYLTLRPVGAYGASKPTLIHRSLGDEPGDFPTQINVYDTYERCPPLILSLDIR